MFLIHNYLLLNCYETNRPIIFLLLKNCTQRYLRIFAWRYFVKNFEKFEDNLRNARTLFFYFSNEFLPLPWPLASITFLSAPHIWGIIISFEGKFRELQRRLTNEDIFKDINFSTGAITRVLGPFRILWFLCQSLSLKCVVYSFCIFSMQE